MERDELHSSFENNDFLDAARALTNLILGDLEAVMNIKMNASEKEYIVQQLYSDLLSEKIGRTTKMEEIKKRVLHHYSTYKKDSKDGSSGLNLLSLFF
jgi:hypothetical protein